MQLLRNLPDQARREEHQLNLLRLLSLALVATRGYGAPEVVDTLSQAQMLNQQLGKPPDPLLLRAVAIARLNFANFQEALVFGDQLLQLADQQGDPILLVEGHYVLGVTLSWAGSFTRSRIHLEQALAHYDPTQSSAHITRYSQDPSVICQCRLAFDLWCLGYPEQAKETQSKGLAQAQDPAPAHPIPPAPIPAAPLPMTTIGLTGSVVGPGDPSYETARRVWNSAIDKQPADRPSRLNWG